MNTPFNKPGNTGDGSWQPSPGARMPHPAKVTPEELARQEARAWVHEKRLPSAVSNPSRGVLPEGEYTAVIDDGIIGATPSNKCFYKLVFRVTQGEHRGEKAIRLLWLTPEGESAARFFCGLIGFQLENLGQVDPSGIHCSIHTKLGRDESFNPATVVSRVKPIDMSRAGFDEEGAPPHG